MFTTLFLIFSHLTSIHDFHVSQCEIEYRPEEQSITMVMHLFIDDLELALEASGDDATYLCTGKEREDANELISKYINSNFQCRIDGKPIQFNFLGKEASDDLMAVWCYIEALHIPDFQEIDLENRVLFDMFDDQKNIVSFEYRGRPGKKHLLFDRKDPVQKITMQ